jgi:hypothetical protein
MHAEWNSESKYLPGPSALRLAYHRRNSTVPYNPDSQLRPLTLRLFERISRVVILLNLPCFDRSPPTEKERPGFATSDSLLRNSGNCVCTAGTIELLGSGLSGVFPKAIKHLLWPSIASRRICFLRLKDGVTERGCDIECGRDTMEEVCPPVFPNYRRCCR